MGNLPPPVGCQLVRSAATQPRDIGGMRKRLLRESMAILLSPVTHVFEWGFEWGF